MDSEIDCYTDYTNTKLTTEATGERVIGSLFVIE